MITAEERALNYTKVCSCINQGIKSPPELYMFVDIEQINLDLYRRKNHKVLFERLKTYGRKVSDLRPRQLLHDKG